MKDTTLLIVLLCGFFAISANLQNDTKIGYVYMDQILMNMDEAKKMQESLDKFSTEKAELLKKNTDALNAKISEYKQKEKSGELTEAGKIIAANQISDLQASLEQQARVNEQELMIKRSDLLGPIATKLEKAMDEVAVKLGYKYVLNSADGTGNSIVVVAPESDDLTKEVMEHLGIGLK